MRRLRSISPAWEKWDAAHRKDCRVLTRNAERIFGWAALRPVSARRVYSGVAEVSVYVATSARGIGVGKRLLQALIEESERNEIWTLQAGIFPENIASVVLHKSYDFREIGVRRRIGRRMERRTSAGAP